MSSNPVLKAGDRIGNYRLIERVASSPAADVWKVSHHEKAAKFYAIKVARSTHLAKQLRREIRSPLVGHEHIVPIIDSDTFADSAYIVTPFYERGSLDRLLLENEEGLPAPRVLRIIQQIVGGLAAAHELGVVHRDIKPGNVLLDSDGTARLTDFGASTIIGGDGIESVAQSLSLDSRDHGIAGTLGYMAPEVLEGRDPAPSDDVYSVGVLAFKLLTGRLPCGNEKPSDSKPQKRGDFCWDTFYSTACATRQKRPSNAKALGGLIVNLTRSEALYAARRRTWVAKSFLSENAWGFWFIFYVCVIGVTIAAGFLNSYLVFCVALLAALAGMLLAIWGNTGVTVTGILSCALACLICLGIPLAVIFVISNLIWRVVQ